MGNKVASEDQALSKQLERVQNHTILPVASDELRSHIDNFSPIAATLERLCQGLIYIREFSEPLVTTPRAEKLHHLSEVALQELAQIRKDLGCFGGRPDRGEIPVDLKALRDTLREKRPHTDIERHLDSAVSQTIPLCVQVIPGLEYVLRVYEMDRQAFSGSSQEPWYATIQENSLRRSMRAQSAIETLQAITLI